jgi:molybdopterin/thiamine biosynthesis adenylyltransferase
MEKSWSLRIDESLFQFLMGHLFPGDSDEHGAVIAAGLSRTDRGIRLLAREVFLARDGVDFVPGVRGYRRLTPEFVADKIRYCRDEGLIYLAIHNHGEGNYVDFSDADNASHERGYPALLDISGGPVGALVFARRAVAADIWTPDRERRGLSEMIVIGQNITTLYDQPPAPPSSPDLMYDRQIQWLGERGQAQLGGMKVGVIGAGGVGLPLVTMLARLGVGSLVVIDPDRADLTNLPRLDVRRLDAMEPLRRIRGLSTMADRLSTQKVKLARRSARRANRKIEFVGIATNVVEPQAANALIDCDFLFLAADSHQARMVFNAVAHQYLTPGIQLGTRIDVHRETGDVTDIRSNVRLVLPHSGCLRCNGLISSSKLQEESIGARERAGNRYSDELVAPSVITFNSSLAAQAASDFLLMTGGIMSEQAPATYLRLRPHLRRWEPILPASGRPSCSDCGSVTNSRLARGDYVDLPLPQRS